MNGCPDKECQANLHKIESALYGKDGTGGIVKCVNNKVPKKWLYIILGFIAIPLITFGARLWSQNQAFEVKFAEKTALAEQSERVVKLESSFENIKKTIVEIKENQRDMQKDIKDILKELRFARENNCNKND